MPEKIDLFEAIDTQRGIRYFKPDPVPDELIKIIQCILIGAKLTIAICSPEEHTSFMVS